MKFVLVTTEYKGVFAGHLCEYSKDGRRIILKEARCAIRWATTKGFIELAEVGPNSESKIGATAPEIELYGVTSVTECTELAKQVWIDA